MPLKTLSTYCWIHYNQTVGWIRFSVASSYIAAHQFTVQYVFTKKSLLLPSLNFEWYFLRNHLKAIKWSRELAWHVSALCLETNRSDSRLFTSAAHVQLNLQPFSCESISQPHDDNNGQMIFMIVIQWKWTKRAICFQHLQSSG